jgi:hypothetical protein
MDRQLRLGYLALPVLLLGACASLPPQPTPTSATTPVPQPTGAPVAQGPPVFCDPVPAGQPAALTCDPAVAAAIEALPPDHPEIRSIEFGYGCPPRWRCGLTREGQPEGGPQQGYVLFYVASSGPQRGLVVRVEADASGNVTATAAPIPWPPGIQTEDTAGFRGGLARLLVE